MILSDFFVQVNSAYRGSDDDVPANSTVDYTLWLATTNRKIAEWARDGKNVWSSLFEIRSIGTLSSSSQTYDLDEEILLPSDRVLVTTTSGNDLEYKIVKPEERGRGYNTVYISGRDPQVLTFSDTIQTNDSGVGGTIKVPAYWMPDDLIQSNDTIPVDDPYWLVYAVAAELAFNDLTYSDKAPDLNNKANNLYLQMVRNNRRGTFGNPRTAQTRVSRINGVTDNSRYL